MRLNVLKLNRGIESYMRKLFFIYLICFSAPVFAENIITGIGHTFVDAFDKKGLTILAVGTGATLLAFSQDQQMHDNWVNNQRMSKDLSSVGNFWGSGVPEIAIAAGQLIWDEPNGFAATESLIASTLVTYGLKYSSQRARPDSDTRTSFPSGHTQISFCSATNLAISYGFWAAIPAYGMAVMTGLSRLADDAHWFSDIVAGAAIGTLFGRAAFRHNMYVMPVSYGPGDRGYGLELTYYY